MPAMYCSVISRRVAPFECGTLKPCTAGCQLRPIVHGETPCTPPENNQEDPPTRPESPESPNAGDYRCNMCKAWLVEDEFGTKKNGDRKKTCLICEEKYLKKPKASKPPPKPKVEEKTPKPTVPAPPKVDDKADQIDLSEFTMLKNNNKNFGVPAIRIGANELSFNAAARQKFARTFDTCQTMDIGHKVRGGKVVLVFVPHKTLLGQYRISRGKQGKAEFKVAIRLYNKDVDIKRGQTLFVREVGGALLAETEGR